MEIKPYLFFEGRCEEAVRFYEEVLGAKVLMLMRFNESPDPAMIPPGEGDKVMHLTMQIGESTVMASDGSCSGRSTFAGCSLSLTVPTVEEGERLFAALSQGGQVQMPMMKTFFSPAFGMVADQFGVSWMVHVMPEQA